MDFEQFYSSHKKRLVSYVSRFRHAWRLPDDIQDDLMQSALLAVWQTIPSWRSYDGGMSAFNWCAGPMRQAMERSMRLYHGVKPRGKSPIPLAAVEYIEGSHANETGPSIEETIDLKRILTADKKPQHVVRLIAVALSPASGGDVARASGISRQAVFISNSQTKKRLRLALG